MYSVLDCDNFLSSFRINQTHEPLSERATATNNMQQCNSINDNNKFHEIQKPTAILNDDHGDHDSNFKKLTDKIDSKNERDYTSAILDHNGGLLVNEYWGVTLSVPENAIPFAIRQQVYFAVSDPRKCPNIGPLDTENGIFFYFSPPPSPTKLFFHGKLPIFCSNFKFSLRSSSSKF